MGSTYYLILRLVKAHPILVPAILLLILGIPYIVIWDVMPKVLYLYLRSGLE